MNRSSAIFASFFWSGQSDEVLHDVTLCSERGVLTEIVPGRLPQVLNPDPVAIIPPLVNAHAHLEFSHLKQPIPYQDSFPEWIGKTIQCRRENPDAAHSIRLGWEESTRCGVGLIGEIATAPIEAYLDDLHPVPREILFREVIGLTEEAVASRVEELQGWVDWITSISRDEQPGMLNRKRAPLGLLHGISPHAPYTVRADLLQSCVELSRSHQLPLMMHLAETKAELELLDSGTGELVEMLQRMSLWNPELYSRGTRPLDLIQQLAPAHRVLLAHGNYLDAEEIAFLADHPHVHVVYCPRTHAHFRHSKHPWRELLAAGVNVAIGTDGRGSNPDLNLLEELRFLKRLHPETDSRGLIEMGTIRGSRALGLDCALEVGKPGAFTILTRTDSSPIRTWDELLRADVQARGSILG